MARLLKSDSMFLVAALISVLTVSATSSAQACPGHGRGGHKGPPFMEGAQVTVQNSADGVSILILAADADKAALLQKHMTELAAVKAKGEFPPPPPDAMECGCGPDCQCGKDAAGKCSCGKDCQCGKDAAGKCSCGKDCQCGKDAAGKCSCGKDCQCGKDAAGKCTCGDDCQCGKDAAGKCTCGDDCQCGKGKGGCGCGMGGPGCGCGMGGPGCGCGMGGPGHGCGKHGGGLMGMIAPQETSFEVTPVDGGVSLVITSTVPEQVERIQKKAAHMAERINGQAR
jgi:hypothetical protein